MEIIEEKNARDLVLLAKSGDNEAFSQLYEVYFTPVFRYVFLRIKNKDEAEIISQEVFLKAFGAIGKFQERGRPFLAYLFTIARNEVIDYWKKPKEIPIEDEYLNRLEFSENRTEILVEKQELNSKILGAISRLSEEKQEVISLKFFGDLKSFEVAEVVGKSEEAVRQMQFRALKDLKEFLLDI